MSQILHRLSHRTRGQIFARVLPVIFLSVVSIGAISWAVFTHHATGTVRDIEQQEAVTLLDNLRRRASLEAMAIEVRQNDFLSRGGRADGTHLVEDLLQMELLDGVALGRPGSGEGGLPGVFSLVDSLATEANHRRVGDWLQKFGHCFLPGFQPATWPKVRVLDGPVLAESNPGHPVYLFPPLLLESASGPARSEIALLPVLVRDEQTENRTGHPVYFLDLKSLVKEFHPGGWWCVLDGGGRVMVAADTEVVIGARLDEAAGQEREGILGVVGGADPGKPPRPGETVRTAVVGNRFLPWIVTQVQGPGHPFTLLTVNEVIGLRSMGPSFVLAVLGVALLAVVLTLFGVSRVVDRVSRHLSHLATSKDEAHRLVQLKAENLRGTLDDMRVLDKAKDDFLILISHEVRTPLTSIMGGVDILKSSVEQVEESERETLERLNILEIASIIEASGRRLTGFMNDAIQMTSIQSRDRKLDLQPVKAADLVEVGLCGVRERAHLRGISVVNELENGTDWAVLCDQRVLKVAFEKILHNAVIHNFDGGRIVVREAKNVPGQEGTDCRVEPEGEYFLKGQASYGKWEHEELTWRLIEIFNTGEPIPENRRKALFGKFELVGRIEHHHKGTGLSIPIASSAVKNHGGRILVHADKRLGNSFFLLLPTVRGDAVPDAGKGRGSGDQEAEGVRGGARHEKVGQVAHAATLEVEFDDEGLGVARRGDQAGGGMDDARGADHEEEVTVCGSLR